MKTLRMIIVTLIAILFVGVSFVYFNQTEQTRFENNFENDAYKIKGYTKDSAEFVKMLSLFSERTLTNGMKKPSDLRYLKYDQSTNTFSTDQIEGTPLEFNSGNITGNGPIDDTPKKKREIELAEELNPYFKEAYNAFPNIAWIYYTSLNGFINLYPFVPSNEFKFSKESLNEDTTKLGTIKENPNRTVYWSEPYLDRAGKGMMVTVSAPVDVNSHYIGAISIDITFESLSKQLTKGATSILANKKGEIIASSDKSFLSTTKIANISQLDPYHPNAFLHAIETMPSDHIEKIHGVEVLKKEIAGTDWSFYYVLTNQEKAHIIGGRLFVIILISTLVVWIFWIAEKRKLAEEQLKTLVSELAEDNTELHVLSTKDALTNALNRRGIEKRIQTEILQTKKEKNDLTFILFDIDSFKQINDCYGHSVGDYVLTESAKTVEHSIRASDILGRWGGEEFILILPGTGYKQAMELAERLRQQIENHPYEVMGNLIPVTVTFGVSVYNEENGVQESIDRADQAMYKGKQNGKNQVIGEYDL
ncbi:sensor domain-containing diguanylate cyclase [Bacillus sp. AFS088145]|uniref:sensor domain-containing diguanylate cyclase n=1 Tax=Bacillus sp. AFS088145 TaxID=2033514 RepID=UPI000BF6CF64|nr:sensor domain-containing diguanylate cyclase [Bacillus sp. AFS088145]PFH82604.1 hypothetical protein COI44_19885 [Bacillus sp. AFS088145]